MEVSRDRPDIAYQSSPSASQPPAEYPNGVRVADKVLGAFNYACAVGDLKAAEELVGVLEKIADRRIRRFGGDRRAGMSTAAHAREHLEWLSANRPR